MDFPKVSGDCATEPIGGEPDACNVNGHTAYAHPEPGPGCEIDQGTSYTSAYPQFSCKRGDQGCPDLGAEDVFNSPEETDFYYFANRRGCTERVYVGVPVYGGKDGISNRKSTLNLQGYFVPNGNNADGGVEVDAGSDILNLTCLRNPS